jgi:hypothetical protein
MIDTIHDVAFMYGPYKAICLFNVSIIEQCIAAFITLLDDVLNFDAHHLILLFEGFNLLYRKGDRTKSIILFSESKDLLLERLLIALAPHLQEVTQMLDLSLQFLNQLVILGVDLVLGHFHCHLLGSLCKFEC